jgi:putative Ca2+/H+ antiporter (TMEM165/GDT1 family)
MYPFLLSAGVIFLAELGDKSQLMAMTFASCFRARDVFVGITVATAIVHLGSVAVGAAVSTTLPTAVISAVSGVAFLGFAVWTLRGDKLHEAEEAKAARMTTRAAFAVGVAFFLAELGDKTMLATVTLATREDWFGTWVGSTVGMVAADALAIGLGAMLGRHLPERVIRYVAAAAFAIFGALLILQGVL